VIPLPGNKPMQMNRQ